MKKEVIEEKNNLAAYKMQGLPSLQAVNEEQVTDAPVHIYRQEEQNPTGQVE